jgi:hypothetical protein
MREGEKVPSNAIRKQRQESFPDEPWRWREDWEQGVIAASGDEGLLLTWAGGLLVLGVGCGVMFTLRRTLMAEGLSVAWLFAVFPIAGLWLLIRALVATARFLRYGRPVLRLDTVPCVLGGQLRGVIEFRRRQLPELEHASIEICERCWLPGDRGTVQTGFRVLWRLSIPVTWQPSGTSVPIALPIPSDGKETDWDAPERPNWRLRLCATGPTVDLDVHFDLPVFAGEDGDPGQTKEAIRATVGDRATGTGEDTLIEDLQREGVRLKRYPAGLELRVSPVGMRRLGFAFLGLVFMAIPVAFWFLALRTGPNAERWLGFIVLAALGAVVGALTFAKSYRVRAGDKGLRITRRILGVPTVWQVPYGHVESVQPSPGRSVTTMGVTRHYYGLDIAWRAGGKRHGLGLGLSSSDKDLVRALAYALFPADRLDLPDDQPAPRETEVPSNVVSDDLQERFPDEPWRWREDWAQGVSTEPAGRGAAAAWLLVVLVPIVGCVIWRLDNGRWRWSPGTIPWALVISGAICLLLLVVAIVATMRATRYGRPLLRLAAVPCPQGGWIRGTIGLSNGQLPASRDAEVELRESHTRPRHDTAGESTATSVEWRLRLPIILRGTERTVSVALPIPSDGKPTRAGKVEWHVCLRAAVPGPNLDVALEIPVFGTEGGNPAQTKAAIEQAAAQAKSGAVPEDLAVAMDRVLSQPQEPQT